jgi:hypothetical protein
MEPRGPRCGLCALNWFRTISIRFVRNDLRNVLSQRAAIACSRLTFGCATAYSRQLNTADWRVASGYQAVTGMEYALGRPQLRLPHEPTR